MTKCAIILPQPLVHCYIRFLGIIQHIYLSVLSENLKTSLCSRTTVFPGFAGTFGMIQQERQNNIINILG
ncbi:hypothetical protein, partial [Dialister hominis]|uniref:hypothetical protein n=1 Tax=Dialister hominis TaxID=2582419 RepID=UPI0040251957